ncbi:sugar ABC transporter permease [Halobaculum limi]|uniref:sugar ABC transporter permease n=1 Tax=Halobaculum limi TaxID=3031916 RepID=UPI0024059E3E|nr:ABC transporter permease subunit [Halobaculum sp. YSMS11]
MSLFSLVAEKIARDVRTLAEAPREAVIEARYTARAYREGEVSGIQILRTVGATVGAAAVVAVLLFPIYWIAMSAISGSGGTVYAAGGFSFFPDNPSVKPFVWVLGDLIVPALAITVNVPLTDLAVVFNTPEIAFLDASDYGIENPSNFKAFFVNSVIVSVPTVLLAMSVIVPAAYALSRREFLMRRKILFGYVLFTQVGGGLGIAALIALYAMFVQVGLNNNRLALAAYYAATAVPFNTWLLKTYMDGIPTSYEEAAIVDGAPPWRVVTEVILPLSTAGLATVFIFTFLTGWMEFVVAQTLLSADKFTLPVGLFSLVTEYSIPWARFSAFALTFASPVMLVYLFAQRYIEGGLSFSGMEG